MRSPVFIFVTGWMIFLPWVVGNCRPPGADTLSGVKSSLPAIREQLGVEKLSDEMPPPFRLVTLAGDTLSPDRFRGQIVLLHFWATWCKPCRTEMPALEALHQKVRAQHLPVVIVGISIDRSKNADKIPPALREMGITFPIAAAFSGSIPDAYWTWGIPVTYIITPSGKLLGRIMGTRDWNNPAVIKLLNALKNH